MREEFAVVACALLLVLSGCGAFPGGGQDTSDRSSPDSTGVGPAQQTVAPDEFPPGTSPDGITNETALVQRQYALLPNLTYKQVFQVGDFGPRSTDVTQKGVDRTLLRTHRGKRVYIGPAGYTSVLRPDDDGPTKRSRFEVGERESLYDNVPKHLASVAVIAAVRPFTFRLSETQTRNGHQYLVYESVGVNKTHKAIPDKDDPLPSNLTVVVRDDGLLTSITGEKITENPPNHENQTSTMPIRYRLTHVTEPYTFDEPAWVSTFPTIETEFWDDGHVVEITNTGEKAIGEGRIVIRTGDLGSSANEFGSDRFDGLAPGESIYVALVSSEDHEDLHIRSNVFGFSMQDAVQLDAGNVYLTVDGSTFYLFRPLSETENETAVR